MTTRQIWVLLFTAVLAAGCRTASEQLMAEPDAANATPSVSVRAPAVAGTFYPADPETLRAKIAAYLAMAEVPETSGDIIGLMAPHAGYDYSGPVAGYAFKAIQGREYDTVVLIGISHNQNVPTGGAITSYDAWRTPLGLVQVDDELRQRLLAASDRFHIADGPHAYEHSLELELPFLQTVLGDFTFVPIAMTDASEQNTSALAEAIVQAVGERRALILGSTDMSHYPIAAEATRVDTEMLQTIATFDPAQVYATDEKLLAEGVPNLHCTLCALGPLIVTMKAARALGAERAEVLNYSNSAVTARRTADRCVGYGAAAFIGQWRAAPTPTGELNQAQQQFLLNLARETIRQHLATGQAAVDTDDPIMRQRRAVFVTLNRNGRLRGCIGQLTARHPLARAVQEAAASAATQDRRFSPVTLDELDEIHIEISVLSPMMKVNDPSEIEVGTHGVLVVQGPRRGVFLPQVAVEQGWDRETMLSELCAQKAGLAPDAWQRGAELYVFTAQIFGEHE